MFPITLTTWKKELEEALKNNNETFDDVIETTLTDKQLNKRFDSGYGSLEGHPFTLWTKNNVYFPAIYDGLEWVEYVPRNPNGIATNHVGGG